MGKVFNIILAAVFVCAVGISLSISFSSRAAPEGVWKDVNSEYYIKFNDDGTYVESTYNIPSPYEEVAGVFKFAQLDGTSTTAIAKKNLKSKVPVNLYGVERVMQPYNGEASVFDWSDVVSTGEVESVYTLKNNFDADVALKLYDDKVFELDVGGKDVSGKYVKERDGNLLLLTDGNGSADRLYCAGDCYAIGLMQSNLTYLGGSRISGHTSLPVAGVFYDFSGDGVVTRIIESGEESVFAYALSDDGEITMIDVVGMSERDYIYIDSESGNVYRYLFERDGWFDYIAKAGDGIES